MNKFFRLLILFNFSIVVFQGIFPYNFKRISNSLLQIAPQDDKFILQELTEQSFNKNTGWVNQLGYTNFMSNCGTWGSMLMFYNGNVVSKTFTWDNVPHYAVKFQYDFLRLDSWESIDWVCFYYDGVKIRTIRMGNFPTLVDMCSRMGLAYLDGRNTFVDTVPHSGSSLLVEITDSLFNEKYGFRDIYLFLLMCDSTCQSCSGSLPTQCLSCYELAYLNAGSCMCRDHFFSMDLGSPPIPCTSLPCNKCQICHSNCKTCFGPEENNCLSCFYPDELLGSQCQSPLYTKFVSQQFFGSLWNNTETKDWVIEPDISITSRMTVCNSFLLFGGLGVFGSGLTLQRVFTNLSTHYAARISMFVLKIDTWDSGKMFNIKIDGNLIKKEDFSGNQDAFWTKNLCGNSQNEAIFIFSEVFSHSGTTLHLEISTTQNSPNNNFWGFNQFELTIYQCNPSCSRCLDEFTCLDCPENSIYQDGRCRCSTGLFLYIDDSCKSPGCTKCLESCPINLREDKTSWICGCNDPAQYRDPKDLICKSCNKICSSCTAGSAFDCIKCSLELYSLNGRCYRECLSPYEEAENKTCVCGKNSFVSDDVNCVRCSSNCKSCEKEFNRCTSCISPLILSNNTCLEKCPLGTRKSFSEDKCLECVSQCSQCNDENQCTECNSGFYYFPKKNQCVDCKEKLYSIEGGKICRELIENCENISEIGECAKCFSDFFLLNSSYCEPIINVEPDLSYFMDTSAAFQLNFYVDSKYFLENILKDQENIMRFKLNDTEVKPSQVKGEIFQNSALLLYIRFDFSIVKETQLSLVLNKKPWMTENTNRLLKKYEFYLKLENDEISCPADEFYDTGSLKCTKKIVVTPKLSKTRDPTEIELEFDLNFQELFFRLKTIIDVTIIGLHKSQYSYELEKRKNLKWMLNFKFLVESTKNPELIVNLKLPLYLAQHKFKKLLVTQMNITMKSYYERGQLEKSSIEKASSTSNTLTSLGLSLLTVKNIASPKSSFSFRNRCIVDIIQFLKLSNINYPPNALAVFESDAITLNSVPGFRIEPNELDVRTTNKFKIYEITPYILNNMGKDIVLWVTLLLVASFLEYLNLSPNSKGMFNKLLIALRSLLTWNFILGFFASNVQNYSMFIFVSFYWPPLNSSVGIFNLVISVAGFLSLIGVSILLFAKIRRIKEYLVLKESIFGQQRHSNIVPEQKTQAFFKLENKTSSVLKLGGKYEFRKVSNQIGNKPNNAGQKNLKFRNSASVKHKGQLRGKLELTQVEELDEEMKDRSLDDNMAYNPYKVIPYQETSPREIFEKTSPFSNETKFKATTEVLAYDTNPEALINMPTISRFKFDNSIGSRLRKKTRLRDLSSDINNLHKRLTQSSIPLTFVNMDDVIPVRKDFKISKEETALSQKLPEVATNSTYLNMEENSSQKLDISSKAVRFSYNSITTSKGSIVSKSIGDETTSNQIISESPHRHDSKPQKANENKLKAINIFLERYSILFENYKVKRAGSLYSFALDVLKNIIISATLVFLQETPVQQMAIIVSLSVSMLIYLIIFRPFKDVKLNIMCILNELVLVVISIICLIICYKENNGGIDMDTLFNLGWIIFYVDSTMKSVLMFNFFFELIYNFINGLNQALRKIMYTESNQRK